MTEPTAHVPMSSIMCVIQIRLYPMLTKSQRMIWGIDLSRTESLGVFIIIYRVFHDFRA